MYLLIILYVIYLYIINTLIIIVYSQQILYVLIGIYFFKCILWKYHSYKNINILILLYFYLIFLILILIIFAYICIKNTFIYLICSCIFIIYNILILVNIRANMIFRMLFLYIMYTIKFTGSQKI